MIIYNIAVLPLHHLCVTESRSVGLYYIHLRRVHDIKKRQLALANAWGEFKIGERQPALANA